MNTLNAKVEQLLHENASDFEIAKVIKQEIETYFQTLPNTFSKTSGKDFLVKHTLKIDSFIKLVYKIALRTMFGHYAPMKHSIPIVIAAMGSYGREQLCVHSDIDLMFVYEEVPAYHSKEIIEKMLYIFWDMGLKLGHRVHELSELPEAAQSDITIKSAILESRFIEGSRFLWTGIENRINEIRKTSPESFIEAKLEEQKILHERFPLTMEPNLKEGFGGFRSANLVFWIAKLLYNVPRIKDLPFGIINEADYREFRMALEFLFRVRSALHLVAGKKKDRLQLEIIPEVAQLLGYDSTAHAHMRFAKKTTESLRTINLFSKIWLHTLIIDHVPHLYDGYLTVEDNGYTLYELVHFLNLHASTPFKAHPRLLGSLIHAQKPKKLTKKLYAIVSEIFYQPSAYTVLATLHEARLLKYLLPPIKKVVNLPQFDGYHHFSVDMHSLNCLFHLEEMQDPFLLGLYGMLERKEKHLLKIVTFLHDSGKGRKKNHAQVGVSLFKLFAANINLDREMTAFGVILIRHHDLMSITAQSEDIYNEETILQFASRFNSKKLLDLIYLLTYADMNGVGEGVYTSFKAKLLRILYQESTNALKHDKILGSTARKLKKCDTLKRSMLFRELPRSLQKKVLSIPSNELFIYNSVSQIVHIATMTVQMQDYRYKIRNAPFLMIEITRDTSFNLSYLLGKLSRLNVINLEVSQLFDGIKYFKVEFDEAIDESEVTLIEQYISDAFTHILMAQPPKPKIHKEEVSVDCEHSRDYATLRIKTKDQKGLLAYVVHVLDALQVDIISTKIHTTKYRAHDLFLIKKDGNFCHNTETIIKELTE